LPRALVALRLEPNLEACLMENGYWLRGPSLHRELRARLRAVSHLRRFTEDRAGRLHQVGSRLPGPTPPEAGWLPLPEVLDLAEQPATGGIGDAPQCRLELRRSDQTLPPGALMVDLDVWIPAALEMPAARLERLRFATATRREVVIHGTPLPSLRGRRYSERCGLALPLGYRFAPLDAPEVVAEWLRVQPGELLVFDEDSSFLRVRNREFVLASHAAVRATAQERS
jgi:hypothetical protein